MKSFSPQWVARLVSKVAERELERTYRKLCRKERAYRTLLRNRGGGEAGSIERGISIARAVSAARVTCIEIGTKNTGGITNVTEPTGGRFVSLAAIHRAVAHPASDVRGHVVSAIFMSRLMSDGGIRVRRSLALVMMLAECCRTLRCSKPSPRAKTQPPPAAHTRHAIASRHASAPSTLCRLWCRAIQDRPERQTPSHDNPASPSCQRSKHVARL